MTRCLRDADVQAYLRGKLNAAQRAALQAHVRSCSQCSGRIEAARRSSLDAIAGHAGRNHQGQAESFPTEQVPDGDPEDGERTRNHSWANRSGASSHRDSADDETRHALTRTDTSVDDFLVGLAQSGLVPANEVAELRELSKRDPACASVSGLIDRLIDEQKLTPYQAQVLARGQRGGLVLGNYVILSKLGEGGGGTVYQARHRRMNRLVALKVLPQSLADIPEAIIRFQREVEAAARLQHPNIAAAYDADEAAGVHFLVMEFVDGPNLAAYVKQRGPLPLGVALRLMAQAARGLAVAHAQGIVHRDIKPSNLMINRQGVVKVLDLGLAQFRGAGACLDLTSDVTQTGRVIGTIDYMAPEQARDAKAVDLRADVYSLGCTLYFLATGQSPAAGKSAAEKLLWHQTETPPPLSSICPQSTPRVDALLSRMLAKSPNHRPGSMHEVADELLASAAEFVAPSELELDGIPLAGDHASAVRSPSHYGQITVANVDDTVVLPQSAESNSTLPGKNLSVRKHPFALHAAALAVALVAGCVVASPFLLPRIWRPNGDDSSGTNGISTESVALPSPGHDTPAVDQPAIPDPSDNDARRLLETVLASGGKAQVRVPTGLFVWIESPMDIPAGRFEIDEVTLDGGTIADEDLALLAYAPRLKRLSLAETVLSDKGIEHLMPLVALQRLNLARTRITNGSLPLLVRMAQLQYLNLEGTQIDDQGMAELARHPALRSLILTNTEVGDIGFMQLVSMSSLIELGAGGTRLTSAGHDALHQARKELHIVWDGIDPQRACAIRLLEMGATLTIESPEDQVATEVRSPESLPAGNWSVTSVDLSRATGFSDQDLHLLSSLPELRSLNLSGTLLNPGELTQLEKLKSLKRLNLGTIALEDDVRTALESLLQAEIIVAERADVEIARRVIQAGGWVMVELPDRSRYKAARTDQLPSGEYAIVAIECRDAMPSYNPWIERLDELPELQTLVLTGKQIDNTLLKTIAACRTLRDLTLSGTSVGGVALSQLARLRRLEALYLADTRLGSDGIRELGNLTNLRSLSLQGVDVRDDDIAALKRLPNLASLDLSRTTLTDAAVKHLRAIPSLNELNVQQTKLTDAAEEQLLDRRELQLHRDPPHPQRLAARWVLEQGGRVTLAGGPIKHVRDLPPDACQVIEIELLGLKMPATRQLKEHLAACTSIKVLDLRDTDLTDDDLTFLQSLHHLSDLRLGGVTGVTDKSLVLLEKHRRLESIDLSRTRVTGSGLAALANSPGLSTLRLTRATQLQPQYASSLGQLTSLVELDLSGCRLRASDLHFLAELTALKRLGLGRISLDNQAVESLAGLTKMEHLDLDSTSLNDGSLALIEGHSHLRSLNLSNNGDLTDSCVASLLGMKQLQELNLSGTTLSPEGIRTLRAAGLSVIPPTQRPE